MLYDTIYRHNQALSPSGLETLPAALHALNAAVDDCRRAGKPLDRDAAVLLLIRNRADVADRDRPSANDLRLRCAEERMATIAAPALLDIAGNSVAGDPAAKRTFHYQARPRPWSRRPITPRASASMRTAIARSSPSCASPSTTRDRPTVTLWIGAESGTSANFG